MRAGAGRLNWREAGLVPAALAGWVLLVWLSHHPPRLFVAWVLAILALEWIVMACLWRRGSPSNAWRWIGWGLAFRVIGLFAIPILEDDHFRFLWDGWRFAVSGNPYLSAPSEHFAEANLPTAFAGILDRVNYPDVPSIYGPVTELGFLISYLIAPAMLWPWKLILFGADVGLLVALKRLGGGEAGRRAALFASWCPLSIFETAFNAHPDALAVFLLAAALLARRSRRDVWLGVASGAAIGAKIFALPLVPFLLWRRRWPAWAGFVATVVVCYAPFWLQRSAADLEALRAFAGEWEFNSSGYALLAWLFGAAWARPASLLLFAAIWGYALWRQARSDGARWELPPGLIVFAAFFLLSPTFNAWYALWLLPFVALRPTAFGCALLASVSLSYVTRLNLGEAVLDGFAHPVWVRPLEFGLIGLGLAVDLWRCRETIALRLWKTACSRRG